MADADLDVVIRQLARQLHTGLMSRAKERRDRFNGLAAKAKGKDTGTRFKMMAKATMEQATAAARRLQMSADNVADSYARSMRLAASAGKNFSYCRHSSPSVAFHSMLAGMP